LTSKSKKCSSCRQVVRNVPTTRAPNKIEQVAFACLDECEELRSYYPNDVQYALNTFFVLQDQVIVAGMGEVLGLNHLAIHAYFEKVEQIKIGAYYRWLFLTVIDFDRMMRSKSKENNPKKPKTVGGGSKPKHGPKA